MTSKPDKSIFITGATGFVGSTILDELLQRGYSVRALVRTKAIDRDGVQSIHGDLFDDGALDSGLHGCDAAIHLVGIIREIPSKGQTFERLHYQAATHVMDAAVRNGVDRFIHMSALGVRPESPSEYAKTKAKAEAYLKQSGLDYTILKPAVIHGPGGEFMKMVADWTYGQAAPYVFMPFFGDGLFGQRSHLLQPIYVADVARAFVDCLEKPETIGQSIDLAGPDQLSWPEMYRIASALLRGRSKSAIGIPTWYAKLLTQILPASLLPFNHSQVVMAGEDNIAGVDVVEKHFGWRARGFEESLRAYAPSLHPKPAE